MAVPIANFMFSSQFSLAKAYLAAKLTQCSYSTSAADTDEVKTALAANSYTVITQQILAPPAVVWNLAPAGYIVSWAGINSLRQFLSYVAQSVPTTNASFDGLTSNFLQYCYDLQKPSILAALGGGTGGPPGVPVFVCGHSAGAALATLLANDLIKNYANAANVTGCYCFGSPKPGNSAFCTAVQNGTTSASMRADRDPICTYPSRGQGIFASIVGGTLAGRLAYSVWGDYADLQTCYSIHPSAHVSLRQDPNFGSTGDDDLLTLMQSFLESNSLPESHSINTYVNRLYPMAVKEAFGRGWTNVQNLLDNVITSATKILTQVQIHN